MFVQIYRRYCYSCVSVVNGLGVRGALYINISMSVSRHMSIDRFTCLCTATEEMFTDMGADMGADMGTDMCTRTTIDMRGEMCIDICADMCAGVYVDICRDMCTDMCMDVCVSA